MVQRLLRAAYARLGPRYPHAVLLVLFQAAYLVVLLGLSLLLLYQPMSSGQFLKLVLVAEGLVAIDNLVQLRMMRRLLDPAGRWLSGERDSASADAAWHALAGLPAVYVRRFVVFPILISLAPWCVYATWELGLDWWSGLILLAGGCVTVVYGVALRYLLIDLAMRPVLRDVSSDLGDDFEIGSAGPPLRWKLLIALPAMTIVTGVVVAGLSTDGTTNLSDLGVDVLVAVGVAFTLSLELTVLLSRSIVDPLEELRRATRAVGRGDLSVRVPVVSTDEAGVLTQSFNAAIASMQERRALYEALGSYVDPEVADQILAEGATLEGVEVEVSVLFLDIQGFTAFAEDADARAVVRRLNDFWEVVVPVLTVHGGHANKFIGDGLLGVFGAPDRREDHADRAVAAAIEIVGAVHDAFDGTIAIGIGVNSGEVVAGTVGGGGRLDFTVIGDVVNTASRVEGLTRSTGDAVLVTGATRALLQRDHGGFVERTVGEVRGKRAPVRVFTPRRLGPAALRGAAVVASSGAARPPR